MRQNGKRWGGWGREGLRQRCGRTDGAGIGLFAVMILIVVVAGPGVIVGRVGYGCGDAGPFGMEMAEGTDQLDGERQQRHPSRQSCV